MKKSTKIIIIIALVLVFFAGIALMAYPMFAAQYAQMHHSEIYTEYKEEVEQVDTSHLDAAREDAMVFNERLFNNEIDRLDPINNGYYDLLDLSSNGVMAYVKIPKIDVTLPIFHGTSDNVLKIGAGHMPESSLPVGGPNTHSVITAHSGMASKPMFSDLELLEVGDTFQIDILSEILTYEVYDIPEPVLPQYIDVIQIQEGEDLCTLITCTPYGVNTHRLLIHARRIFTPEIEEIASTEILDNETQTESVWKTNYKESLITGIIIVAIALFALIAVIVCRKYLPLKKKINHHEE